MTKFQPLFQIYIPTIIALMNLRGGGGGVVWGGCDIPKPRGRDAPALASSWKLFINVTSSGITFVTLVQWIILFIMIPKQCTHTHTLTQTKPFLDCYLQILNVNCDVSKECSRRVWRQISYQHKSRPITNRSLVCLWSLLKKASFAHEISWTS